MLPEDPFAALYVIEVDTRGRRQRIKVGYTTNALMRFKRHRATAAAHGCKPGREYASPPGSGSQQREDELIAFCLAQPGARQSCREYFTGADFSAVVRFAVQLCGDEKTQRAWSRDAFYAAMRREVGPERVVCSVEEAARWLSTTEAEVQDLTETGKLRSVQIGRGRPRVRVIDLEGLFQDQEPLWRPLPLIADL